MVGVNLVAWLGIGIIVTIVIAAVVAIIHRR
jgi:hypothetical protein